VGFIFVDTERPLADYVRDAKATVAREVQLPPGIRVDWVGQFKYFEGAKERLKLIVPITLLLVFLLLYLNTRSAGANHGLRGALNAMLSGVQTVIPDGSLIRVDGVDQKKADVVTELQAVMTQYAAVDSSAAAVRADRAQLRQALPAAHLLLQHLKDAMIAYLGRGSPELQKFGLKARSGRKPTVQQKALAAEKARRTRALRGTKGSRQKAAIRFVGEPTLVLGPNSPQPSRQPASRRVASHRQLAVVSSG
jgi:hypothetical protein